MFRGRSGTAGGAHTAPAPPVSPHLPASAGMRSPFASLTPRATRAGAPSRKRNRAFHGGYSWCAIPTERPRRVRQQVRGQRSAANLWVITRGMSTATE
ncbi:hypothetical protein [Haladaptatus sp. W1]|uniref:hypothetical protein n=1 Tax=Haladaptatus sp. W1 TaxID=1897478 RepID=UPI001112D3D4|nr:hypothetical protein [Haladaptatus sp. W1]